MAKRNWPHPVLDSEGDDYQNCAFQAAINVSQTRSEYFCSVRMDLGSETLLAAISRGDAAYALQIHCAKTSFRKAFKSQKHEFAEHVPEQLLRDAFSVRPLVVAKNAFTLSSREFNPIFNGMAFDMSAGYVLALAAPVEYIAEKSFDDLQNIKSIFQVIKHSDPSTRNVDFDFEQERIAIVLPHHDFEQYRLFAKRKPYSQLFVCSLVLPALHAALLLLCDQNEDDVSTRWRRVLKRKLKESAKEGFDKEKAFLIAQEMLEMPYERGFGAIREVEETRES